MSKLEVDKITPQSGTTLTIGDSGDTIVIDSTSVSGAKLAAPTLVGSASSAGSILFKEDTDNGTNAVTLKGPAATADVTLNLPAANDTIVGRATTDTLTNKTINGSQIINSTLALDKLANGTDGNIISYDANGAIVAVATGNDGQVLTSTGAGSPPAFETLPAGVTLSGTTNNTVATVTGANALVGEANLTFDGTTLGVNGGAIFNESGADVDFRVESDISANGFLLDGATGNVGIGLSGPTYRLQLTSVYNTTGSEKVFKAFNNSAGSTSNPAYTYWDMGGHGGEDRVRFISYDYSSNSGTRSRFNLQTTVDGGTFADRLTVENDGDVTITPKLQAGTTDASLYNNTSGSGWFVETGGQQTAANQKACADWNRMGNDGTILGIYQAGSQEGSISVSGSTVSYNGFTGTHWSRFTDNSKPTILRGTVLETLDEMCYWYNLEFDNKKIPYVLLDGQSDGDVITYDYEGTDVQATIVKEVDVKHMMSKVSDTTDAKNVYGLFIAYDLDGEGYNDFYVASVGSYVVRIKSGETLAKGDLLQSNGDGTAKVQSDDNIKSSSFAKVLSTTVIETYEDGSYLVPCSLMC